jgi:NAD(P)-dependent dehydrogenase (short-subunit alcohol dehydrogenase family)/acyl dehydratase
MWAERDLRFAAEDVERFAVASGDRNPLHTDREFAAATAFGAPIVHGSLIAIAMLGVLSDQALASLRSLHISFSGPVAPGTTTTVTANPLEGEPEAWKLVLTARGRTLARVLGRPDAAPHATEKPPTAPRTTPSRAMRATPAEPGVHELSSGHALRGEYATGPGLDELAARFGAGALDRGLLEGLAWASYVVGMELPGLRSLFAGLVLALDDESRTTAEDRQTLVVRDYDERTGALALDGALATRPHGGQVRARIQSFALASAAPPDPAVLGLEQAPGPERGAVVVAGGSRGFGASLALRLLALGYEVHVAYARSPLRAAELARLAGSHAPRLRLTRTDVGDPEAVRALAETVTAEAGTLAGLALNAAPPPLAMGLTPKSATELADYVAASLQLAAVPLAAMLPSIDERRGWVLFCSSTAIAAPPRDWPHYVSAKAAIEGLAGWTAASRPRLRTAILRAPKMRTAMTATPSGLIGAASSDAVAVWTAEHLAGDGLEPGLTTLEPSLTTPEPGLTNADGYGVTRT